MNDASKTNNTTSDTAAQAQLYLERVAVLGHYIGIHYKLAPKDGDCQRSPVTPAEASTSP